MRIKVDKSSAESREYWTFVSEKRDKVASWPAWKRGFLGSSEDPATTTRNSKSLEQNQGKAFRQ